ncbi:hypothetical protein RYZ26_11940 [Terasakiella sp. A23]|uniref:hypothetical protein n=1 Tax=Terasakiella sp. FCG-A23 TaxID=3080561 RepID=UPI002954D975|nr:hypothetical protein [Terasakiella sp. A23]MDV7340309.1 hypothetical protein [Terasakiella sp. A23]
MEKNVRKFHNLISILDKKVEKQAMPNQKWASFVALTKTGKISDQPMIHAANALMAFGFEKKACDMLVLGCEILVKSGALLEKMVQTLRQFDREREAVQFLKKRIKADPQDWAATRLLGRVYYHQEDIVQYQGLIDSFLESNPDHLDGLVEKASYQGVKGQSDIQATLVKILDIQPDHLFGLSQMVQHYAISYEFDQAGDYLKKLKEHHADHALYSYCQGMLCDQKLDYEQALVHYNEALARNPEMIEAYGKSGGMMVKLGRDLEEAWYRLEARFPQLLNRPDGPFWRGEDLEGKKILIWAEQGIGDQLSFVSMLRDLPAGIKQVDIECEAKLVSLYQRSFPDFNVYPRRKNRKTTYDYHMPIGALARYLRPDLDSFTKTDAVPLVVDVDQAQNWQSWLDGLGDGKKVGLAWRSGTSSMVRSRDAAHLIDDLGDLLKLENVQFINLFYADASEELAEVQEKLGVTIHTPPELDQFDDIDGTAALIKNLDLMVGVACAPVRLAQSVGVETVLTYTGDAGAVDPLWWPWTTYINRHGDENWDITPILDKLR